MGGLIGLPPDDLRLREAYDEAERAGLEWEFEEVDLGEDAHPNTAVITTGWGVETAMRGASLGGGRMEVSEVDGFPVSLGRRLPHPGAAGPRRAGDHRRGGHGLWPGTA